MDGLWVIGYGSLLFKPPPHAHLRLNGYLKGYVRRFWQSSSDHRGTPEHPGRVATLVSLEDLRAHERFHDDLRMYGVVDAAGVGPEGGMAPRGGAVGAATRAIHTLTADDLRVWGCAYYVAPQHAEEVRRYLDVREQDGYTLHRVPFHATAVDGGDAGALAALPRTAAGDYYLESAIYIGDIDNASFVGPEDVAATAAVIRASHGPSGANVDYLAALVRAVRALDPHGRSRDFYLETLMEAI
ncbi:Gamma-glutamylcyclotransferase [[Candida] zeylanoides]